MKLNTEEDLSIQKVEFSLNRKIILLILVIAGLSVMLSGCLMYIFSSSLISAFCGLVIGVTIGVLINYFLIISQRLITKIDVELAHKERDEDLRTVMKIR